jgi:hypothetical protein
MRQLPFPPTEKANRIDRREHGVLRQATAPDLFSAAA